MGEVHYKRVIKVLAIFSAYLILSVSLAVGGLAEEEDTDGDGLLDGWDDSDGDWNYTAGETEGETGDASGNGGHGTDPATADTDGDGLTDDYELSYEWQSGTPTYVGVSSYSPTTETFTDPLNTDTDGDDISDGMEANGYNLTYMIPSLEGEPEQFEINGITSDPTDDTNGERDLDGDGMEDYKEKAPLSFFAITSKMNATEIQNQFNPFVKENIPPVLFENDMTIESEGNINPLKASWAHIKVRPSDVGGIEKVEVRIKGWMLDYVEIYDDDGDGWYEGKLEISYAIHYLFVYTVEVKMTDNSGNVLEFEMEQEGMFAGVVDFVGTLFKTQRLLASLSLTP